MKLLLFGTIGFKELLIIAAIFLLLFGTRLPNILRNLGRGVSSFKQGLKEGRDEDDVPAGGKGDGG